jgi:hypothetical protein
MFSIRIIAAGMMGQAEAQGRRVGKGYGTAEQLSSRLRQAWSSTLSTTLA